MLKDRGQYREMYLSEGPCCPFSFQEPDEGVRLRRNADGGDKAGIVSVGPSGKQLGRNRGAMTAEKIERWFERALFAARWLVAPIYVGLITALIVLVVMLAKSIVLIATRLPTANLHDAVVAILSLIDLSLIANLVLIVLYTGYESFVSKLDIQDHEDRPGWLGKVDFNGLKLKLFASIVAITGIELLKAFMDVSEAEHLNERELMWLVAIHLVSLVTMIGAAFSQWLTSRASDHV